MKRLMLTTRPSLLDSGVHDAWSSGQKIDLKDYIEYCVENNGECINLDGMPSRLMSKWCSRAELEEGARRSYVNQQKMRDAGLHSIPVFNYGERIHWLEQMLRDGETYIGLQLSPYSRFADKRRWLDMVFNILTDVDGRPYVQTHGFGASAAHMVGEYPWRSVDCTEDQEFPELYDIRHRRSGRLSGPDHFDTSTLRPLRSWLVACYHRRSFWKRKGVKRDEKS